MKILFLDIDGVLNHKACWVAGCEPTPLDTSCILVLDSVLAATDARIVLSSSWRDNAELEAKLASRGVLSRKHSGDWRTPWSNAVECRRGVEIAEWLRRHPNVRSYAIVDDDSDMLPEQMAHFVKTDFHNGGLTRAHGDRLISILNEVST